jgi:hypothetical protein
MTKPKRLLHSLPAPSDPTSSTTSSTDLRPWKPHGPTSLPSPSHPNYLIFLQETAHQAMYAAEMEMDEHSEIVASFIESKVQPPFTLRDTLFHLTAMSVGAELLMMIAQHRQADASPTLFHPDGRPL